MAVHLRLHAAHRPHVALWVLILTAVLLHSGLCAPGVQVRTLHVTACASASAGVPQTTDRATDRATELDSPCTPVPEPHHAPCGVRTHRGSAQERDDGTRQSTVGQRCPPAVRHIGGLTWPGRACPRRDASQPPARRSGAGLLIDLCASRT